MFVAQTILLVDDSQTMRQVLRVYLMGHDFDFIEAAEATRAMLVLRTSPVDLIIADINMPGTDGITFARDVRNSHIANARRIPIVIVTADRSEEVRSRAVVAGVDAFLVKPVDATELTQTVERLLLPASRRSGSMRPK
jgi:two-component system chemotaxis response regulator CheY